MVKRVRGENATAPKKKRKRDASSERGDKPKKKAKKLKKTADAEEVLQVRGTVAANGVRGRAGPAPPSETQPTNQPSEDEWLQVGTRNPWVKLSRKVLKHIEPMHQSLWLKFKKKDSGKRCGGGLIVRNESPKYIKLRNPYNRSEFSVQVPEVIFFIRSLDHITLTRVQNAKQQ